MSLFAELLWKQLPNIDFPGINSASIKRLSMSWKYSTVYHISIKLLYHIYYLPYNHKQYDNKQTFLNKFHILHNMIIKNNLLSNCEKDYFIQKYSSAQNTYSAFRNLAKIYKIKYCKKFEMNADLCFNEFSTLKPSILISLIEDNVLYTFRVSDIINIINKSLTNAPMFFADPYDIKNPYTNLPFSLCNLYNIYFKLKDTSYIMPILFQLYYNANFNLNKFKNENECFIRDKAIDNFIITGSFDEKYIQILRMFYVYHKNISFKIDTYFPKEKLVYIFKKYLKSFLLEEYSLNPHVREVNKIQLEYNLTLFSQLNPNFGKRIWVKRRKTSEPHSYYRFNDMVTAPSDLLSGYFSTQRAITPFEYANGLTDDDADDEENNQENNEGSCSEEDVTQGLYYNLNENTIFEYEENLDTDNEIIPLSRPTIFINSSPLTREE